VLFIVKFYVNIEMCHNCFFFVGFARMSKWDLSSEGGDSPSNSEHNEMMMQDGQGPLVDFLDMHDTSYLKFDDATKGELKSKNSDVNNESRPTQSGAKSDVEWNITTPNISPPHDGRINAKELDMLMSKVEFEQLAKQIFQDEKYWTSKSWLQSKFTGSKITHPEASQHWQQRYKIHLPNKEGEKLSSIYQPFIRLLIGEFVLKWNVDYRWKCANGEDVDLKIHPSVALISANRNKTGVKDVQVANVNRGKRKTEDVQKKETHQNEVPSPIRQFFVKK